MKYLFLSLLFLFLVSPIEGKVKIVLTVVTKEQGQKSSSTNTRKVEKHTVLNETKSHSVDSTTVVERTFVHPTPAVPRSDVEARVLAKAIEVFRQEHIASLQSLLNHESNFNHVARNPKSGACGIFQAMPCERMGCADWTDIDCQVNWGFAYITRRYGNPTRAWEFWQSRQPINGRDVGNWY